MAFYSRDLLAEAVIRGLAGAPVLLGSAAAIVRTDLPFDSASGRLARSVQIPYFGHIGEAQDLPLTGGALSPVTPESAAEVAPVTHSGKAILVEMFDRLSSKDDPYDIAEKQMAKLFARRADKAIIDLSVVPVTDESGVTNVTDVWSASTPVYYGVDVDALARTKWGDENTGVVLRAVHSRVWADLITLKDSTGVPLAQSVVDGPNVKNLFLGVPTLVTDRLPVDLTNPAFPKYTSLLFKAESTIFWSSPPSFETDRDILAAADVGAMHFFWAAHRYLVMPDGTKPGVQIIKTNGGRPIVL